MWTKIDYEKLGEAVNGTVRFLDDCIDVSINNYNNKKSEEVMNSKRKIGLGICGFADMLIKMDISYDSDTAEQEAANIMSFINYKSKQASIDLAKKRGRFPAFKDKETRYHNGFIAERYGKYSTETVSSKEWKKLSREINQYGIRNCSTTAIPPTGRSSAIIGASAAIEPYFNLTLTEEMQEDLRAKLVDCGVKNEIDAIITKGREGRLSSKDLPAAISSIYKTCLEISPQRHLRVVAMLQKFTDESIAKTVNMAENSTPADVLGVYLQAYELGLKGITTYRNNSRTNQPKPG
ncbi:MAG: hypothetical protein ABIF10_01120 [Candidatus Woesearchaeota archaeon]